MTEGLEERSPDEIMIGLIADTVSDRVLSDPELDELSSRHVARRAAIEAIARYKVHLDLKEAVVELDDGDGIRSAAALFVEDVIHGAEAIR